jgi:hypothetical protein
VEESGALHNKNNENSIIPNPQIEQGDKQDCVIEDGVFHDNLSKNSMALVLADIKNLPSQLTYVDNNPILSYSVPGDENCFFHSLSLLINGYTTNSSFYRNIICTHIIHNWQIWEDKIVHSHTNNMTIELYQQYMINRTGWATATEIEVAAHLFGLNINIWLQQSSHCTLSSFNASSPTCIDILLSRNHFSPSKRVSSNTDNSFDILKNQLKRQGQQNKTLNNKKRKMSTKITPHLEEGNRQTEQESEKQCQFIYTAELCEEKDFENVSIPHLSVQNKTARVQVNKNKTIF